MQGICALPYKLPWLWLWFWQDQHRGLLCGFLLESLVLFGGEGREGSSAPSLLKAGQLRRLQSVPQAEAKSLCGCEFSQFKLQEAVLRDKKCTYLLQSESEWLKVDSIACCSVPYSSHHGAKGLAPPVTGVTVFNSLPSATNLPHSLP